MSPSIIVRKANVRRGLFSRLITSCLLLLVILAAELQAAERSCQELNNLRSLHSNVSMTLTFVNTSGIYRSLDWIDFQGQRKSYGGIQPGETKSQPTFETHVWVLSTGPGDCTQVFIADPNNATVEVTRKPIDRPPSKSGNSTGSPPPACATNFIKRQEQCVPLQNCGANAVRTNQGACVCKKHFTMRSGRCVPTSTTCTSTEVYSSSMAQCVPIAATCSPNEVYNSNRRACVPRRCPRGTYLNQNGACQPNETGG